MQGQACPRSINLAWDASPESDVAGYRVYRGSNSGSYTESIDVGKVTEYTWVGVPNNARSFFSVTAYRLAGTFQVESDFSDEVFIDIATTNLAPTAHNDVFTINEDSQQVELKVLQANGGLADSDPDICDELRISKLGSTNHGGSIQLSVDRKSIFYQVAPNFYGIESFVYYLSDGDIEVTATVTINVTSSSDAPVANDDLFLFDEDSGSHILDVMADNGNGPDTDADGDPINVISIGSEKASQGGKISLNSNGTVNYTPKPNFEGTESFTYTLSDGSLEDTGVVTITITALPDPPVGVEDFFLLAPNGALQVSSAIANDMDPDLNAVLSLDSIDSTGLLGSFINHPTLGQIYLANDAAFTALQPGETLATSFTYIVKDETGLKSQATKVNILGYKGSVVLRRRLFYNNSRFDGKDSALSSMDDQAVSNSVLPLMPGQTAGFANISSFDKGINGLAIDIVRTSTVNPFTLADFEFRVGNDDNPSTWSPAPAPATMSVRQKAGYFGSTRITFRWEDGAIQRTWLCVTIKANSVTGLASKDVFYFGNAVGKTSGDSDFGVDTQDELRVRNNPRGFFNPAPIDFEFDFNRDGQVNAIDQLIIRKNVTGVFTKLKVITPASF